MKRNAALFLLITIALSSRLAEAEETGNTPPSRHMTLQEAVQMALKHNHNIRIAGYTVEEKRQAKEFAKSSYFPSIRNDSSFMHVTDTQLVEINAGSLGLADGTAIPPVSRILNQGGRSLTTSGTQITQPLTTLLKIKQANDVAQAEVRASREKAQLTGNDVALAVHQVYYKILIAQAHRSATEELSDLNLKLNDLIGLPLTTALDLDPAVAEFQPTCLREECVRAATASHPEILAARAEVEKVQAAARLAKTDIWVPDVEAFARYSYANNVPFLARNFGTFGIHFGFDVFDSGRKKASLREREAQLSQAKENLAKLRDDVELTVQTAYNKLDRTQQMLKVSEEVVALRTESNRVLQQRLLQGAALNSQAANATAQQYDAKALLLQSQLDFLQANDELLNAIGRTPE